MTGDHNLSNLYNPQFDIIVTGDVVVDHHIYEGERQIPAIEHLRGVRAWRELGGADVVRRLLEELFKAAEKQSTEEKAKKEKEEKEKAEKDKAAGIAPVADKSAAEKTDHEPEPIWQVHLGVTTPVVDETPAAFMRSRCGVRSSREGQKDDKNWAWRAP